VQWKKTSPASIAAHFRVKWSVTEENNFAATVAAGSPTVFLQTKNVFRKFCLTLLDAYASGHVDGHYGLDRVGAARPWHWLGQILEMESAQSARARTRGNGSRSTGKNAQQDEPGTGNGSAAGIDAAIQYFLNGIWRLYGNRLGCRGRQAERPPCNPSKHLFA
jgi:hypothetical protein